MKKHILYLIGMLVISSGLFAQVLPASSTGGQTQAQDLTSQINQFSTTNIASAVKNVQNVVIGALTCPAGQINSGGVCVAMPTGGGGGTCGLVKYIQAGQTINVANCNGQPIYALVNTIPYFLNPSFNFGQICDYYGQCQTSPYAMTFTYDNLCFGKTNVNTGAIISSCPSSYISGAVASNCGSYGCTFSNNNLYYYKQWYSGNRGNIYNIAYYSKVNGTSQSCDYYGNCTSVGRLIGQSIIAGIPVGSQGVVNTCPSGYTFTRTGIFSTNSGNGEATMAEYSCVAN